MDRGRILTAANGVSILRILLVGPFVMCLLAAGSSAGSLPRLAAVGLFAVMAASDALDGYLARRCGQATALGAFLDPLADKLMITCASVLLALPATAVAGFRLPATVVVLIVSKDLLLVLGFAVTYFLTANVHIKPVLAGKLCTFFQICLVLAILIGPEMAAVTGFWPLLARLLWWVTAFWAVAATFVYIWRGIRYIERFGTHDDRKPEQE